MDQLNKKNSGGSPMMRKITSQQNKENEVSLNNNSNNPLSNLGNETDRSPNASFIKFPNVADSFDISKHMSSIEDNLSSKGLAFEQRLFLEQIADNLDNFVFKNSVRICFL